mgnify:CR=1 FL=1
MKDLESYLEVHYEIVQAITIESLKDEPQGKVLQAQEENGHGGLYMLAKELTDKFQEKYENVVWGVELEYFDTIEEFIQTELFSE